MENFHPGTCRQAVAGRLQQDDVAIQHTRAPRFPAGKMPPHFHFSCAGVEQRGCVGAAGWFLGWTNRCRPPACWSPACCEEAALDVLQAPRCPVPWMSLEQGQGSKGALPVPSLLCLQPLCRAPRPQQLANALETPSVLGLLMGTEPFPRAV